MFFVRRVFLKRHAFEYYPNAAFIIESLKKHSSPSLCLKIENASALLRFEKTSAIIEGDSEHRSNKPNIEDEWHGSLTALAENQDNDFKSD